MTDENEFPIPIEWKAHFGEETFYDIFVYTKYGDRTPEEALGILGLEPPPEKRMEPEVKQEDSKPSMEKIEVTTPEISIKEDIKQEVKMEENKVEKVDWFGFSDEQAAERSGAGWFPSFSGEGFDEITMDREDLYGDKVKGAHPGFHRMQLRELPQFLADEFRQAAERGSLPRTYGHFISELGSVKNLDVKVVRAFKKYQSTVEGAHTQKQQIEVLGPLIEYLGQMRREKI